MGWTSIFSLIDKLLPGREERIRTRIRQIEKEREKLYEEKATVINIDRINRLTDELFKLENKLKDR